MKIFVDTAKLEEIEQAHALGILDGVTTNPSLVKKVVEGLKEKGEDINIETYLKKILELAKGLPVSLEVIGSTYDEMVKEGRKIYEKFNPVANNVYVKIPVNPAMDDEAANAYDGIRAIKTLSDEGIPINCTLIFTPEQALMAAKAGAKFVSPFAGRIDDYIKKNAGIADGKNDYFPQGGMGAHEDNGIVSGVDLVAKCVEVFDKYDIKTEVLAASIRNSRQVRECALAGAHIATLPFSVIKDMMMHYKTTEGMIGFTKDIVPEYASILRGE